MLRNEGVKTRISTEHNKGNLRGYVSGRRCGCQWSSTGVVWGPGPGVSLFIVEKVIKIEQGSAEDGEEVPEDDQRTKDDDGHVYRTKHA